MSRLIASIPNANARVASRTTNELACGMVNASTTSAAATIRTLTCWLTIGCRSLSSEQAGGFNRQDENHRGVEREVGHLREQRPAEIVGEADEQRADRGAAEAAHAADDHDREGQRQHFEIKAGVNSEKGAAGHAAERGEEGAERENEHQIGRASCRERV